MDGPKAKCHWQAGVRLDQWHLDRLDSIRHEMSRTGACEILLFTAIEMVAGEIPPNVRVSLAQQLRDNWIKTGRGSD